MIRWHEERPAFVPLEAGFTLLELALVILVMGLISGAVAVAYGPSARLERLWSAQGDEQQVMAALVDFARTHARLPCPDLSGDGQEGAGGSCPSDKSVGWVPYRTLKLPEPAARNRAVYGVYRNPGGEDLTVRQEHTGDLEGSQYYDDLGDFERALKLAVSHAQTRKAIHTTTDRKASHIAACKSHPVRNWAVIIVEPMGDQDGNGDPFDGVDTGQPGSGGSLCFAPPSATRDANYSDDVAPLGFNALAAELSQN